MSLVKTIVIKPTMRCNLRCDYCYEFLRNGTSYHKSNLEIDKLCAIVERTAGLFPDSRILWMFHGGEPLLEKAEYFKTFADCVRKINKEYSVDYQIALQTNATLLTDAHINILEKNADLLSERIISVSIDGPREINDITRHTIDGKSAYQDIVNAIEKIRNSNLKFSIISVVGRHNVECPKEVFEYLKSIQADLCKFVPCYNFDCNGVPEKYGIRPLEFANFMCRIFDLWMHNLPEQEENHRMVIEPIASIICNVAEAFVTWCEYRDDKCANFTCIYPDGDMWLCDNFIHETMKDTAYVKNIFEVTDEEYKKVLLSPSQVCAYEPFYEKMMTPCYTCGIYSYCKGGCIPTRHEMFKKSEMLHEEYCEAKKLLISYIKRGVQLALS